MWEGDPALAMAKAARDLMKISRKVTPPTRRDRRYRIGRREGGKSHLLSEKFSRRERERGGGR